MAHKADELQKVSPVQCATNKLFKNYDVRMVAEIFIITSIGKSCVLNKHENEKPATGVCRNRSIARQKL